MGLAAARKALQDDAKTWETTSADLRTAANAASVLSASTMNPSSPAVETGFLESYRTAQTLVVELLTQGANTTAKMAGTLNHVYDLFHDNDEATAAQLANGWTAKER
jgi:hypothetical protein